MKCPICGYESEKTSGFCDRCGVQLDYEFVVEEKEEELRKKFFEKEKGTFIWFLLSLCLPFVGVILYFCWKDKYTARKIKLIIGSISGGVTYVVILISFLFSLVIKENYTYTYKGEMGGNSVTATLTMTPNENIDMGYFTLNVKSTTTIYYDIPGIPYPYTINISFYSTYAGTWTRKDDNRYLLLTDAATYEYGGNDSYIKQFKNELIATYGRSKGKLLANGMKIIEFYYIDKLYQYIEINDSSNKFVFLG